MPRGLTPDQVAAAKALLKSPATFVELQLPGDPIYAWDGAFNVKVLGKNFLGVGQYGVIQGLDAERSTRDSQISIGLMGLPTDKVPSDFLINAGKINYQGRPLIIYLGFCDPNTGVPLSDPYEHWGGIADVLSTKNGKTVSISLSGTGYASKLRFTNGLRMSTESHTRRVGNGADNFYDFGTRLLAQPRTL